MNMGIINSPILWLTDPDYMLPICMLVILWMSLGTGFLSFVAGLQGLTVLSMKQVMWTVFEIVGRNYGTSHCRI